VSFCLYALRDVSVAPELTLGHLRYFITDVPPQPNSQTVNFRYNFPFEVYYREIASHKQWPPASIVPLRGRNQQETTACRMNRTLSRSPPSASYYVPSDFTTHIRDSRAFSQNVIEPRAQKVGVWMHARFIRIVSQGLPQDLSRRLFPEIIAL